MGLDVYLFRIADDGCDDVDECERVDLPSTLYPDHGFRIGYFRSRYGRDGMDRVLKHHAGTDMSRIMGRNYDDAVSRPDWVSSIRRAYDAHQFLAISAQESPQAMKELLWYMQAITIMIETCEWVMRQPDPERYALHWSS